MGDYIRDKVVFDEVVRGFRLVATYLSEPKGEAVIDISKDGVMLKSILWPAYKVWNVAAHAEDIVADIEDGLSKAGWTGFGNVYTPEEKQ